MQSRLLMLFDEECRVCALGNMTNDRVQATDDRSSPWFTGELCIRVRRVDCT